MYSPHDQLPAPEPRHTEYPLDHFYQNTAKPLIKDTIRIMDNGLAIDMDRVIELEATLAEQLQEVEKELAANPLIKKYLEKAHKSAVKAYVVDRKARMRTPADYEGPFKHKDPIHRSYFMEEYAKTRGWSSPDAGKLPTGVPKWSANLVKKYAKSNVLLQMMLEGNLPEDTESLVVAMRKLAQDKANLYNNKYVAQVENPEVPFPKFNPASPKQKQELFAMLGLESEEVSKKTGLPSWDRTQIERINEETQEEEIKNLTQSFIDHSFAAIVKNNFIEAFYTYTVDGRLYGTYKLLGAKTGRYTSATPNMLNMPSTRSRFAKPIKKCFIAPKGKVIVAADYNALEDRVIASLSRDANKCDIFLKNLDGHSLNALGYFPQKIAKILNTTGDTSEDAIAFKLLVDNGNEEAEGLRQDGKGVTFGLAYGAYPPKIAKTLKIPLHEGQEIFDNYHQILYPGITTYREGYVLATAKEYGEVHLGLGFTLKTDDADNDIRTLSNATCQFWSILTALAINKMHQLIDEAGYEENVKVISTIYDSIYLEVDNNAKIVKWVNDNLIKVMTVDFMEGQAVKNESECLVGFNWAEMSKIANYGDLNSIENVLKTL
jgi:DNA polymerase I-like protein with 3'-5' exonuclease and polymerase domains